MAEIRIWPLIVKTIEVFLIWIIASNIFLFVLKLIIPARVEQEPELKNNTENLEQAEASEQVEESKNE